MQSTSKNVRLSPENLSQAGAGTLLLAFGIVELWLASPAAEWWYRCGASLVALAGSALLARAIVVLARPLRVELARRARRWWQPAAPPKAASRVLLAE